jgi:hypothetical protein
MLTNISAFATLRLRFSKSSFYTIEKDHVSTSNNEIADESIFDVLKMNYYNHQALIILAEFRRVNR